MSMDTVQRITVGGMRHRTDAWGREELGRRKAHGSRGCGVLSGRHQYLCCARPTSGSCSAVRVSAGMHSVRYKQRGHRPANGRFRASASSFSDQQHNTERETSSSIRRSAPFKKGKTKLGCSQCV